MTSELIWLKVCFLAGRGVLRRDWFSLLFFLSFFFEQQTEGTARTAAAAPAACVCVWTGWCICSCHTQTHIWPWGLFAGWSSWVRPASVIWARESRQPWMSGGPSSAGPAPTLPGTGKVTHRAGSGQPRRAAAVGLTVQVAAPWAAGWLPPRQPHGLSWDWSTHSDKHRSAFFTLALSDSKETLPSLQPLWQTTTSFRGSSYK